MVFYLIGVLVASVFLGFLYGTGILRVESKPVIACIFFIKEILGSWFTILIYAIMIYEEKNNS